MTMGDRIKPGTIKARARSGEVPSGTAKSEEVPPGPAVDQAGQSTQDHHTDGPDGTAIARGPKV